jgi:hypothetical protein
MYVVNGPGRDAGMMMRRPFECPSARSYLCGAEVAEPTTGIEPVASSLPRKCSTPELRGLNSHQREDLERETGFEPATLSLEG